MKKLLSIYQNIVIKEISYEKGDKTVYLKCNLVFNSKTISTTLLITQSDFNRMLSKIILNGYSIDSDSITSFWLGDGTEIVEYSFQNSPEDVVLTNFNFNNHVKQICA